jgi:hypothetical protein
MRYRERALCAGCANWKLTELTERTIDGHALYKDYRATDIDAQQRPSPAASDPRILAARGCG